MADDNLQKFLDKFKANSVLALKANENAVNGTINDMYKKIVDRTPVGNPNLWHPPYWPKGYKPGKLKASWGINYNNAMRNLGGQFSSESQLVDNHGLVLKIEDMQNKTCAIYNNQPYAQRIEEGSWSTQAPAGMMRVTVAEFTNLNDQNAAKFRIK